MHIDLGPVHPRHGTHRPTSGSPERTPGSVRRTVTTDMVRPEGPTGPLLLHGRGRDLRTDADGRAVVLASVTSQASVDFLGGWILTELTTQPGRPALAAVVGVSLASGFRAAVARADPALATEADLLHLLVDDLPVTTLVSSHAYASASVSASASDSGSGSGSDSAEQPDSRPVLSIAMAPGARNQCAGFADGATIMAAIDGAGSPPLTTGPAALRLTTDDPVAWHETAPLPPGAMRRARRMDVRPGDPAVVDVLFRDSYVRPDGLETVIHEYTVVAEVDVARDVVLSCRAEPRVLPWIECPVAAASAARLAGVPLSGLRAHVRRTFKGTSTCTHLNDTLRSLEDVTSLLHLASA